MRRMQPEPIRQFILFQLRPLEVLSQPTSSVCHDGDTLANSQTPVKRFVHLFVPIAKPLRGKGLGTSMARRELRADLLLAENIRTLLAQRRIEHTSLAMIQMSPDGFRHGQ